MGVLLDSTSRDRQLSHFGEALLATTILLAGLVIFLGSWGISDRTTSRGEICLKLPNDDLAASLKSGPVENQLLRQYLLGTRLIQALSAASPAQRVRLNEQLNGIVRELDSLCHLNMYYYNQGAALLTLATTSATVVVVCLLLVAPEGVQNITRAQRTMLRGSSSTTRWPTTSGQACSTVIRIGHQSAPAPPHSPLPEPHHPGQDGIPLPARHAARRLVAALSHGALR